MKNPLEGYAEKPATEKRKYDRTETVVDKLGITRMYGYTPDGRKYLLNVAEMIEQHKKLMEKKAETTTPEITPPIKKRRRGSKIDERIDQVVDILKQYGNMSYKKLEELVNFGSMSSESRHFTVIHIVKAGEEIEKLYVDRSEKPEYVIRLTPPEVKPTVREEPLKKTVPAPRPTPREYNLEGIDSMPRIDDEPDEEYVEEKKPKFPIRDLIKSNKLGIRLGPEGKRWIDLGMGYGQGTDSREMLIALQEHGPMDVTELEKYWIFLKSDERNVGMLRALSEDKVIELYAKDK